MEEWSGIITIIRYLHSLPSTSKKHGDFSQHVCYRVKTWCMYMGVSENSVPLNPMVLLIIIPIKWLFHWEYTLFPDKPICLYIYWSSRQYRDSSNKSYTNPSENGLMTIPQGLGICWSFWPWHIWEESSTCNTGKPNLNPTFHVEMFTSTSCWFMRLRLYITRTTMNYNSNLGFQWNPRQKWPVVLILCW